MMISISVTKTVRFHLPLKLSISGLVMLNSVTFYLIGMTPLKYLFHDDQLLPHQGYVYLVNVGSVPHQKS